MIYKLLQTEYELAQHLFESFTYQLIIQAVIAGTSPGSIYVDNLNAPLAAFLSSCEGFYLAGNQNPNFIESLQTLIKDTLSVEQDEIALGIDAKAWEPHLSAILPRLPFQVHRKYYRFNAAKFDWQNHLAEGYSIHRIDRQLLAQANLIIPENLLKWMEKNWRSVDQFLQGGLGCCCLQHREQECEIVSWSITDCISGDRCEIGVETAPAYRERGLAALTVAATVEYCLAAGLTVVGWHCTKDNVGSWKVAEKVGFEHVGEYVLHYCMMDEVDHLAEMGYSAFQAGDYQATVTCYDQLFTLTNKAPDYLYHLAAQACAAVGDYTKAIEYLSIAIDQGWQDIEYTQSCDVFKDLQNDQVWQLLLTQLEAARLENEC